MNPSLQHLEEIASKQQKKIIGLMSGTSLDGLDIALCSITGSGEQTVLNLDRFKTCAYPPDVTERLKPIVSVETVSLEEVTLAHTWLGRYHADLILQTLSEWKMEPSNIDCIASHGQTIYHAPLLKHQKEGMPDATLQIGDGDQIARKTGILTVSDFRQKHTAAGGEGAPMVSLVDRLLFKHDREDRFLLNIGGIANFSYLPARGYDAEYVTTDTGPGNTLIDAAVQRHFEREYDRNGRVAESGSIDAELLKEMKEDPYFGKPFPKSTGPEMFNLEWVERCAAQAGSENIDPEDLVATLTWLTAETVAEAIRSVKPEKGTGEVTPAVYLSGGGMHNKTLVGWIEDLLEGCSVVSFAEIGYDPDAKEAASFAVLANETLSGEGFLIDPRQGPERRVNFGKISLPV